jgi:hypothetical protein
LAPTELPETDPERLLSEMVDAGHRAIAAVMRSVAYVVEQRARELGLDVPQAVATQRQAADEMFAYARRGRRGAPLLWNRPGSPTLRAVSKPAE